MAFYHYKMIEIFALTTKLDFMEMEMAILKLIFHFQFQIRTATNKYHL